MPDGVFAGLVTITAVIQNSAYHVGLATGAIKMEMPEGMVVPEADPAELAERLWNAARDGSVPEIFYPER